MSKKVVLDPSKVQFDGKSFTVVLTDEELQEKFTKLKEDLQVQKDVDCTCSMCTPLPANTTMGFEQILEELVTYCRERTGNPVELELFLPRAVLEEFSSLHTFTTIKGGTVLKVKLNLSGGKVLLKVAE